MIELLIKYRADVSARDERGDTPLLVAVLNEHVEAIDLLLESKG